MLSGGIATLVTIAAWLGLCATVAGFLYLSSIFVRGEFADEPLSDEPHGDWPAIPDDFKSSVHSTPLTKRGQQDHV